MRRLLNQLAWAGVRTKGSYFQDLFRRLVVRIRPKVASWPWRIGCYGASGKFSIKEFTTWNIVLGVAIRKRCIDVTDGCF
jgi:hypothetical protein